MKEPINKITLKDADTIITVRRLIREAWTRYRWAGRPARTTHVVLVIQRRPTRCRKAV